MTSTRPLARPVPRCPIHGCVLEGGHVQYRCPRGRHGHRVQAADINREVRQ